MSEHHEKGAFQADIPQDAVEEALRSVERAREPSVTIPVEVDGPVDTGGGGGEGGAAGEAPQGGDDARVQLLEAQLELSQSKARETLERLKDQHERYLRAAADLENYRKRAQKEKEEVQKFGSEKLLKDLLPVLDNLDRALASAAADDPLVAGVKLVRASFEQALARHGVKPFTALGQPFDPARHEALMQVPTADAAPGTVVMEHARGFTLNDRLVRPAMVGVSVAVPAGGPAGSDVTSGG